MSRVPHDNNIVSLLSIVVPLWTTLDTFLYFLHQEPDEVLFIIQLLTILYIVCFFVSLTFTVNYS